MYAKRRLVCVLAVAAMLAGIGVSASADIITPVSATASSSHWSSPAENTLTWGSMSSGTASNPDLTATLPGDAWGGPNWLTGGSGIVGEWITFDLGAAKNVGKAYVWQLNQDNEADRGVHNFTIEGSANNSTWKVLTASSTVDMTTQGGTGVLLSAEQFALTQNNIGIQYIRFTVNSNYGDPSYAGLGEVRFTEAIPEPGTMMLLATALAGLLGYAWRKR
jgi:hypothetical protein